MVSLLLYLFLVLPVLQFVLLSSPSALPLWRRSSWVAAAGGNGLPAAPKASASSLHFAVCISASCFLLIFLPDESLTSWHISVAFW